MRKAVIIAAIVSVMLLVVGVALVAVMLTQDESVRNITLNKEGEAASELRFDARNILPGQPQEYKVVLHGGERQAYTVTLTLDEASGNLVQYLQVDITCGDMELHGSLTELLGKINTFSCAFAAKYQINVRLSIPAEVGNEAMGAEAQFVLGVKVAH